MDLAGDLGDLVAKNLPKGVELTVRHVSSTPAPSTPLFAAAPGQNPEPTFCESHYLSVSIDSPKHDGAEIIVFGMEVLVYTTTHLTTIFVSKADSTGFLHLIKLPRKSSILKIVSQTFLSYLARTHQRPGVRLVVSLFARAQNQYLFPGSIENAEKHVLDDRGLIKWWCKAVEPILREHEPESIFQESKFTNETTEVAKSSATAYLIVPGCDQFETRTFFPISAKSDPSDRPRWVNSYPLHQIVQDPSAPPRCLVPRLPDDPKTRFLIDLDDELPTADETENAPPASGVWRSVKSLDQFWEMMSFRQECSAGRLVGFLWLVINPPGLVNSTTMASQTHAASVTEQTSNSEATKSLSDATAQINSKQSKSETELTESTNDTTTPIASKPLDALLEPQLSVDHPRAGIEAPSAITPPTVTPFSWPEAGRGQVVLSEADYNKMMDAVLDQFYDANDIVASTRAFVDQVASLGDQLTWGKRVVGSYTPETIEDTPIATNNLLSSGLIRKRKKSEGDGDKTSRKDESSQPSEPKDAPSAPSQPSGVNVLNASLVRKKKKT